MYLYAQFFIVFEYHVFMILIHLFCDFILKSFSHYGLERTHNNPFIYKISQMLDITIY